MADCMCDLITACMRKGGAKCHLWDGVELWDAMWDSELA